MAFDFQLPNITAVDSQARLSEMQSYLYQLVQQLNWALNSLEKTVDTSGSSVLQSTSGEVTEDEKEATFNSVKALIIKSADIVNAYYETINERFSGDYVAKSEFGEYCEQTTNDITKNSKSIEQIYSDLQTISAGVENLESNIINVLASIKSGLLDYDDNGVPVYGIEIGQKNIIDGEEVFNKFARFTSDRLSFYDSSGNDLAYISDYKLYITNAQITGSLRIGGYVLDVSDGIAFKWA